MQSSQSQSELPPSRFRWTLVALLCAVAFVLYIDRINIMIAAPHLEKEFDLSSQMMGNVLSAFLFGYALGLVPGGWLADRFGPHRVLTLAGLSWGVLTVVMGCVQKQAPGHTLDSGSVLVLARFLLGQALRAHHHRVARDCGRPGDVGGVASGAVGDQRILALGRRK